VGRSCYVNMLRALRATRAQPSNARSKKLFSSHNPSRLKIVQKFESHSNSIKRMITEPPYGKFFLPPGYPERTTQKLSPETEYLLRRSTQVWWGGIFLFVGALCYVGGDSLFWTVVTPVNFVVGMILICGLHGSMLVFAGLCALTAIQESGNVVLNWSRKKFYFRE